jgi:hypothetical protein
MRNSHFRAKFGITITEADAMVAKAGKCEICRKPFKDRRNAHIDHDHDTGEIRGVLCGSCNGKLGWYQIYRLEVLSYLHLVIKK